MRDANAHGRDASELGLTVLRTWAFADGPQWNAIQPSLGVLDERVLSEVTSRMHVMTSARCMAPLLLNPAESRLIHQQETSVYVTAGC